MPEILTGILLLYTVYSSSKRGRKPHVACEVSVKFLLSQLRGLEYVSSLELWDVRYEVNDPMHTKKKNLERLPMYLSLFFIVCTKVPYV